MTSRPRGDFRIGKMRERIAVQSATEEVDSNGQTNRTWSNLLYREPAQWIPTSGGETIRGKQIEAGINAVFIVRFRSATYTPELRIVCQGETYGIKYVQPIDGQRRYIQLECKAVVG